jgi:hypothetical protein
MYDTIHENKYMAEGSPSNTAMWMSEAQLGVGPGGRSLVPNKRRIWRGRKVNAL